MNTHNLREKQRNTTYNLCFENDHTPIGIYGCNVKLDTVCGLLEISALLRLPPLPYFSRSTVWGFSKGMLSFLIVKLVRAPEECLKYGYSFYA